MKGKIKVVVYSRLPEKRHLRTVSKIPQYITQELDGEYAEVNCCYFCFLWHILLNASDMDVLILDSKNFSYNLLSKCYRLLNPMGKHFTLESINQLLHQEEAFSSDWTKADYRRWVNQTLLPLMGFTPLAEIWNIREKSEHQ